MIYYSNFGRLEINLEFISDIAITIFNQSLPLSFLKVEHVCAI
jgi:hypothetical protein